eukprot:3472386-Amphidinium_carterae.2
MMRDLAILQSRSLLRKCAGPKTCSSGESGGCRRDSSPVLLDEVHLDVRDSQCLHEHDRKVLMADLENDVDDVQLALAREVLPDKMRLFRARVRACACVCVRARVGLD